MYQLTYLRGGTIRHSTGPDTHHEVWLIVDEHGEPITTLANRQTGFVYKPHPDERSMLRTLQREFPGHLVVNCPDPHAFPEMRARFEARIETKAVKAVAAPIVVAALISTHESVVAAHQGLLGLEA